MAQDAQLKDIHTKVIRKRTISKELLILRARRQELDAKVKELSERKLAEQKDVERLEKRGITSLFYSIVGKKEEKLKKERAEALDATQQYEQAFLEVENVKRSIELKETELATLEGYEEKFEKLLQGKRRLLEHTGLEAERKVLQAEKELALQKEQQALLEETEKLGETILEQANKVQETLSTAEKYAIAQTSQRSLGIQKSELLSQAQKQVTQIQPLLRAFTQKLELISEGRKIQENLNVVYEFGNGIYTSYVVGNTMSVVDIERIRTAKGNVMLLRGQIQDVLSLLSSQKECCEHKIELSKEHLEKLIIEV
ncbi:MAG: hypothetical protein IKU69_06320 [Roseburia sp.]|nr:hypothetical protein [Roseburia sp.]